MKKSLLMLLAAGAFSFATVACESKTENVQEERAEEVEETVEEAADEVEDAVDSVEAQ